MARRVQLSNSFSAGEIAPEMLMRADLQVRNEALKQARNVHCMQGGGFRRRPGTVDLDGLPTDCIIRTLGTGVDDARLLIFYVDGFQERLLDGTLVQNLPGAPWNTLDRVRSMQVAIEANRAIVTSHAFFPAQVKRNSAGVWALTNFAFAPGLNSGVRQPYWRYAPPDVTIAPSAYTGSVTVTASAATFGGTWVGYRIRYAGIEMEITGYISPTQVTATVLGTLYPTVTVTIGSTAGFSVGQQVQGDTTQIAGVVSAINSGTTMTVQVLGSYTVFSATEKLIGPTSFSTLSAVATAVTPAATLDWDEALISPARGFPGSCALHRTRLLMGDFPNAKNVIAASAVGDITDFDVGDGSDINAVVDTIGNDSTLNIRHFGSAEQLLILTEAGPHYIPEQVAAPFSATNLEALKIGPEAAGDPAPVLTAEGMLFSESSSGRAMIAIPTGNVRKSWEIADLSELAYHLMGAPFELALQAANSASDRLVLSLRDDGQIAAMNYRRGQQFSAWSLWSTQGRWRSITVAGGDLYVVTERTIPPLTIYRLEKFVEGAWGDGMVSKPSGDASHFNGLTVAVWDGDVRVAALPVAAGDVTGVPGSPASYDLGLDFNAIAEIVPVIDSTLGLSRNYRITRAWLDVLGAINVRVNGFSHVGFQNPDGIGGAMDVYAGTLIFNLLGRQRDMTLTITQTEGGPFEVRSLTMEIVS